MGALAPLINQTLGLYDITYSPADSAGRIFVTEIKKRPDTSEEVENILRKTAHWEGGRGELSQLVRILEEGGFRSVFLVTFLESRKAQRFIQKNGDDVKKILGFIEKIPETTTIEDFLQQVTPTI